MNPYYKSKFAVPSAWDIRAPSSAASQAALALVKVDALRVLYVGPGGDEQQAVTVRANGPVPHDVPLFYFEMLITDKVCVCVLGLRVTVCVCVCVWGGGGTLSWRWGASEPP